MTFINNSRIPYWLLFVIYLTCNCILWVMFTACIGALVDLIDFLKLESMITAMEELKPPINFQYT